MHTISQRPGPFGAAGDRFDASCLRGEILAAVFRGFEILLLWQRRANQRHAMAQLDDRMLRDLGLSRADVVWESRKPFWRA
jgi:uncharacterized protein YjiS (DUF1127 family)